jgi:hypothetical protein
MAAAATARRAAVAAPRKRKRPALAAAPARRAPQRSVPARRPGGQLIPIAVGTAAAVRRLPDSGLVVRLTRGRAWIAVLGVLLAGIVTLNVITLSLAADAGHVERNVQALAEENPLLRSRDAQRSSAARVRNEAAGLGLSAAAANEVEYLQATAGDVAIAARRLAAAGG